MTRLALVSLCVLGLSGVAAAQMPGLPDECTDVTGEFEITSVTADTVEGTLSGDIEGTLAGTVTETNEHTFGFGTISFVTFTGTVTTATGTLDVMARLVQVELSMPGMPGMPPMPTGSVELLKLLVTGGTGDHTDQVGFVFGLHSTLSLPPFLTEGYHGILCDPPVPLATHL